MLKEMVASGAIPAIEDRLPAEPLIVEPRESIGKYGGTWRRALYRRQGFHACLSLSTMTRCCAGRPNSVTRFSPAWPKEWSLE
ncbi:MAG: hypothetical protein R3E79_22630 [Caldilineaceae bacterium]